MSPINEEGFPGQPAETLATRKRDTLDGAIALAYACRCRQLKYLLGDLVTGRFIRKKQPTMPIIEFEVSQTFRRDNIRIKGETKSLSRNFILSHYRSGYTMLSVTGLVEDIAPQMFVPSYPEPYFLSSIYIEDGNYPNRVNVFVDKELLSGEEIESNSMEELVDPQDEYWDMVKHDLILSRAAIEIARNNYS